MDMAEFPGWSTSFELLFRQEQSRHASGRTRVKDFGTPIWTATYQSVPLRPNELDEWRARLAALGNGLETFKAWPTSRCWPINAPNGAGLNGTIFTGPTLLLDFINDFAYAIAPPPVGSYPVIDIGPDRNSLLLGGVPIALRTGDYIQVDQYLHQITEVQNNGYVSLAPHLSPSITIASTVILHRPSVTMSLVPGSVNTASALNGRGSVTFQAIEARG